MKEKIKSKRTLIIAMLLLCSLALAISVGVTYARYYLEGDTDAAVTPNRFYFESDLLKPKLSLSDSADLDDNETSGVDVLNGNGNVYVSAEYELNINYIRFYLMTYSDGMRASEVDVSYEIKIYEQLGETETELVDRRIEGQIPVGNDTPTPIAFTGLKFGSTYRVEAISTAPYAKTLEATFVLIDSENSLSYEIVEDDSGSVVYMTLRTNDLGSTVKVYWPEGYVPDNSSGPLAAAATNPADGITLESNSVYEFRFYKSDLDLQFDTVKNNFYVEISAPFIPEDNTEGSIIDNDGAFD